MVNSRKVRLVLMMVLSIMLCLTFMNGITAVEDPFKIYDSPNWANHETVGIGTLWVYEHSTDKNADFTPMTASTAGDAVYDSGHATGVPAKFANPWNTALFFAPGFEDSVARNAVMAFVVPADGTLDIAESAVIRNYGVDDGMADASVDVAIYHNDTKIWPAGTDWAAIADELVPLTVPAISDLEVAANDKIRFVVNWGNPTTVNWADYTEWQPSVELKDDDPVIPDYSTWNIFSYDRPGVDMIGDIGTIWTYEYSSAKNTDFTPMITAANPHLFKSDFPTDTYEVGSQAMCTNPWNTVFFLAPGYYVVEEGVYESINAVLTFEAPYSGVANIEPCEVIRNYGLNDAGIMDSTVEIAVFLNDSKIWPEGSDWGEITSYSDPVQLLAVPAIRDILVEAGDKIRFVVNFGEPTTVNWADYTDWPVNIKLHTLDAEPTAAPTAQATVTVAPTAQATVTTSAEVTVDPTITTDPTNPSTNDFSTTNIFMVLLIAAAGLLLVYKLNPEFNPTK